MASQRVLIVTIGGPTAERLWEHLERGVETPHGREKEEHLLEWIIRHGETPPILYRSEHVDLWSMGDVFAGAVEKLTGGPPLTWNFAPREVFAGWLPAAPRLNLPRNASVETRWLHARLKEAAASWDGFAKRRLLLLIRTVLGGLWMDEEVTAAVEEMPAWWEEESL